MGSAPRGVVALWFTDIEGSTALWDRAAPLMRACLHVHHQVVRDRIARHGGYEVKTESDAFMVAFADAAASLGWAADVQLALLDAPWPEELLREPEGALRPLFRGLRVRMGGHVGEPDAVVDPVSGRVDYLGPPVNQAARVAQAARGGQVIASAALWERASLGELAATDLGEHRLKGLSAPVRLVQVLPPALAGRTFEPRTDSDAAAHLPPAADLHGRDADLAELARRVAAGVLVTLHGPGGAGKTSLAVAFARAHAAEWPGGARFVDLSSARTPEAVAEATAAALGLAPSASPAVAVGRALAGRKPTLLVLDNFEQVLPAAGLVAGWLAAAPGCAVVATSREALGLRDERVVTLGSLGEDDAAGLFVARAGVGAEEPALVREIVRRLDVPLAIEFAAARASTLGVRAVHGLLDEPLRLLASRRRDLPARQATADALVRWSWDLLDADERAALAELSVLRGGFDLALAGRVVSPRGAAWVPDLVDGLVRRSLVRSRGERFSLHEVVRAFAAARLDESGGTDATVRRLAHALATLGGERFGRRRAEGDPEALGWLVREADNLLAALAADDEHAAACAGLLGAVVSVRGPMAALVDALDRLEGQALPPVARAWLAIARGRIARRAGHSPLAAARLREALDGVCGIPAVEAEVGLALATALRNSGDLAGAQRELDRAAPLVAAHAPWLAPLAALYAGNVAYSEGRPDAARALWEEARALAVRLRDPGVAAMACNGLGLTDVEDPERAVAWLEESIAGLEALGLADVLVPRANVVVVLGAHGRLADAAALAHDLVVAAAERAERYAEASALVARADVLATLGDDPGARADAALALAVSEEADLVSTAGAAHERLADVALRAADTTGAARHAAEMLACHRRFSEEGGQVLAEAWVFATDPTAPCPGASDAPSVRLRAAWPLARGQLLRGRPDEARETAAAGRRAALASRLRGLALPLAELGARLGDAEAAAELPALVTAAGAGLPPDALARFHARWR